MSKSKLRKEYEAVFGVVDGTLRLYDAEGNNTYCEDSKGWWEKGQYDAEGNQIYIENSNGEWCKYQYDADGNMIYRGHPNEEWSKYQYDDDGNVIYSEDSREGVVFDNRPCSAKVFIDEKTGKKFKMTEIK
jgi:YD repeat-containing protein